MNSAVCKKAQWVVQMQVRTSGVTSGVVLGKSQTKKSDVEEGEEKKRKVWRGTYGRQRALA